jgi:CHAT domain-containing protein
MATYRLVLLAGAAALLSACQAVQVATAPAAAPDPSLSLGQNLLGEECRMEPRKGVMGDPQAVPPQDIYCGTAKRPVAALNSTLLPLSFAAEGEARREGVKKLAADSGVGREQQARLACENPAWTSPAEGVEILATPCTERAAGWSRVTVAAAIDQLLFQGDGTAATMPILERAMLRLSGRQVPAEDRFAEQQRLEVVTQGRLALVSSADLDGYEEQAQQARLYNSTRNYAAAEAAWRRALAIKTRVSGVDSAATADVLVNLALEVSNQGRVDEAEALMQRADPIVNRSPDPAERARLSTYRAFNSANQGNYGDALKYAREATALRRGLVDEKVLPDDAAALEAQAPLRGELARSLLNEAVFALQIEDLGGAEAAGREAVSILALTPNQPPWWRADALATMGAINAKLGRARIAERNYKAALQRRQELFGDTAPTARTYLGLGQLYAAEEDWLQAVESYRAAFAIYRREEVARTTLGVDQVLPFLTAATALAAKEPSQRAQLEGEMLSAVQFVASGITDQTIARTSARLAADDPRISELVRDLQEAQRKRDSARIELANETAKPDDRRGAAKEEALTRDFQVASASVDSLSRQIAEAFPDYSRLASPGPAELAELKRRLAQNEAVLVYGFGRDSGFALLVRPDRVIAKTIDLTAADVTEEVTELRRAFEPRLGRLPAFDLKASHELYKKLVAPLNEGLGGVEHLIAVPSGALASLPLGVLVTEPAADYRTAAWLGKRFAISQVPSVRSFLTLRIAKGKPAAPQPLLAFANPTFEGAMPVPAPSSQTRNQPAAPPTPLQAAARQCREGGPMAPDLLRALEPLPETAAEVESIARLLGAGRGSVVLGRDATEDGFRQQALENYRVLYFATHGLLPGELRCQSEPGLVLTPPRQMPDNKARDGLLDASEIALLRLNADLVVLSACNTAAGGGKFGGEALAGLAEAFFYAGARSLLASHWAVPSAPTVRLMTGLFERAGSQLTGGGGLANALRQSQQAIIANPGTSHPFFWAAFTMVGDGGVAGTTVAEAGVLKQ